MYTEKGNLDLWDESKQLAAFLHRLLPSIDAKLRFTVAAEILLWNHYCEHISARSFSPYFRRVYQIEIDKRLFPEILERINTLGRTYPNSVREFKEVAFDFYNHWEPVHSPNRNFYKEWSRLQDEEKQEQYARDTRGSQRKTREAVYERREYSDRYSDYSAREDKRPEKVYYYEERRSSEHRPSRVEQRASYNAITREPGMPSRDSEYRPSRTEQEASYNVVTREPGISSRGSLRRFEEKEEKRLPNPSASYSETGESRPRVVVIEPRRRK